MNSRYINLISNINERKDRIKLNRFENYLDKLITRKIQGMEKMRQLQNE